LQKTLISTLMIFTMVLLSSCTIPGGAEATPEVSVDAIYTAAAQTMEANAALTAAAQPTEIPTDTPEPATPTLENTPTSDFTPTASSTPEPTVPMVTFRVGSNCRTGPSTAYEPPVTTLAEGTRAEIKGRNSNSSWWYVQVAGRSTQCWVFGDNVNVQGDTSGIPVIQPPPVPITATFTPKPDINFDPSFDNIHECGGEPFAIFEIDNTGEEEFESMSLKIEDTDDDEEIYSGSSDSPFMDAADLCPSDGEDTLDDDDTAWVGGNIDNGEAGNDGEATITLCTEEGLKGVCVTETVEFDLQ